MTQEEKAKAYDEALEKAKEIKEKIMDSHLSAESCKAVAEYIDTIIPELAESEDEKIVRCIEVALTDVDEQRFKDFRTTLKECIAYLEKQKEPHYSPLCNTIKDKIREYIANHFIADTVVKTDMKSIVKAMEEGVRLGKEELEEQKLNLTVKGNGFYKICPHCKSRMIRDDSKVYTSIPPQYGYNCPKCGAMEFDTVMYDNPEMEEQKPDVDKYMEGYAKGFKDAEALYNNGVAFHIDNPCICKLDPNVVIESKTNGTDPNVVVESKTNGTCPNVVIEPRCDNFEENIRNLLHNKLTWHSEDGSISTTVLIDDKTLKDIINGIWFYVGKEAFKHPNKELKTAEWSEEDEWRRESSIKRLEEYANVALSSLVPFINEDINWLKSLRPQSKEESNEDKIANFFDAIGDCGFSQSEIFLLKECWKHA